jgi:hypothetical protein
MTTIDTVKEKQLNFIEAEQAKKNFNNHLVQKNAIATSKIRSDTFDIDKAKVKSREALSALNAHSSLQAMLASQMLSIYELQQTTMAFAIACADLEIKKYYTNSAIKLTNCFTQQANILAKLQGVDGQKIIVERVDVHQGGQAIVGNVQGGRVIRIKYENNLKNRKNLGV